jgi:hypothetical protein
MKILHLDIETAPHRVYVWGLWDQNVALNQIEEPGYTLCWSAKWHGKREVMFDSVHKSGAKKMVRRIYDLMNEADAIVHYNGLKFDIPTLNQEFLLQGLTPPAPAAQIDLYQTAKRRFRLASNKLDFVAQVLGIGHKLHHKGMELWRDCMKGDAASWRVMERYNKQDVRLLEGVYLKLLPWIKNHPNHGNFANRADVCPNCGGNHMRSNGLRRTATSVYIRLQCMDCGNWARGALPEKRQRKDGSPIRPLRAA